MHRTRLRCATAVCQNSFFCAFEAIFTAPFFLPDVATACASAGSVARMTLHDPTPPALEGSERAWEPDPGVQPAPAWMAGLWHTMAGPVDVLEIEPARASFRIRAGTKEPGARASQLAEDDAHRVLFALTLGTSDAKRLRGLATDGRIALPMSSTERE